MIIKPTSRTKLKEMFIQLFLSTTDKVTKVSQGSVLNATAHGVANVSQRILKDISVLESNIFPESAFGSQLDAIAQRDGIPARFGSAGSTVYVRLSGNVGTQYLSSIHQVTGKSGLIFQLEEDVTIPSEGYVYAKCISVGQGAIQNIDALDITTITPNPPSGHKFVINEYAAQGGRDDESDDLFRIRIKEGVNILAKGTLSSYEQAAMKINNNILKMYKGGFNSSGQLVLYVSTVNGALLTSAEITALAIGLEDNLCLADYYGGVDIQNISFQPIDVSLRVDVDPTVNIDDLRIDMQVRMQKTLDWRTWTINSDVVEWENFAIVAKQVAGVERVYESYVFPQNDIQLDDWHLPRIRGFQLLDKDGNLISDGTGTIQPAYYPNEPDYQYQQTVL